MRRQSVPSGGRCSVTTVALPAPSSSQMRVKSCSAIALPALRVAWYVAVPTRCWEAPLLQRRDLGSQLVVGHVP